MPSRRIKIVKKKKTTFDRFESDRYKRLHRSWRRPHGIDCRVRRRYRGCLRTPKCGHGSNKKTRFLLPNYKKKFLVNSLKELECAYNSYDIDCTIPKTYFKDQKNGYYYAYQTNHALGKSPCYEAEPIKVILPDDSKSFAEKLNIYGYIFALLIAFTLI